MNFKRYSFLVSLILVIVMCFSVSVFAAETSYDISANGDGSVTAVFNDETGVLTISGSGVMADYTAATHPYKSILSSVTQLVIEEGVQNIGDNAFYTDSSNRLKGITSTALVIPDSVTRIGDNAFYRADKITSIELPASITSIGMDAFKGCTAVESFICLSANVPIMEDSDSISGPSGSYVLGKNASNKTATVHANQLYMKDFLESIGYTVTTVGTYSLDNEYESYPTEYVYEMGADNASDVIGYFNEPTGVFTVVGSGAIKDYVAANGYADSSFTQNLDITSIIINEGITRVGNFAFYDTPATSVALPSSLTEIGDSAFKATPITSLTVPANVETIGAEAFSSNVHLTTLNFESGSNLKTIGDHAFYTAQALTSVEIPDGVTYIGKQAFKNSSMLATIIIPESVEYIGEMAFQWYGESADEPPVVYNYGDENQYIGEHAFDTRVSSKIYYNSANTNMTSAVNSSTVVGTTYDLGSSGSGSGSGSGGSSGSGEGGSGGSSGSGDGGSGGSSGDSSDTSTDTEIESEKEQETMIIVDAEPTNFLVTVPIMIEVNMDRRGNIDCGDGYYVHNECALGPIIITDIKVVAETNWQLADWNTDFANMAVSSKKIGLTINDVEVGSDGSVVMNTSLSSVIRNQEKKELTFDAKLSAQRKALKENVAAVVFTVDFDKV